MIPCILQVHSSCHFWYECLHCIDYTMLVGVFKRVTLFTKKQIKIHQIVYNKDLPFSLDLWHPLNIINSELEEDDNVVRKGQKRKRATKTEVLIKPL